jgi:hypothetical protein
MKAAMLRPHATRQARAHLAKHSPPFHIAYSSLKSSCPLHSSACKYVTCDRLDIQVIVQSLKAGDDKSQETL